ncbi:DUF4328 domain-containing protein [Streptomyces sp. NBC_00503]|uniref:DUF4328 domain-containing protein n=1 Tax=Streptomyces sp. NBC_00503 TaxID=2903659 RepID=UPI002E80F923|nr:DUF4328 domain-containing protein [Streptomyces sp. NBC_00503]WUD79918.1 DUF4328 domain-containing protein [Streptomyces sp. NBC_00503]
MSFSPPGPPPAGHASEPLTRLRSPQGLATATTVLLALTGVMSLVAAGLSLYASSIAGTGNYTGPLPEATLPEGLLVVDTVLQLPLMLATAVLFVIWFHRAHGNSEIFNPGAITRSQGWAVGAWFVPVGNLFIPYTMAKEMWTASIQLRKDGSYRSLSEAPVTAWWLTWVAALISDRIFTYLYDRADTFEELSGAATAGVPQGLLIAAAAVLAIRFVRRLTALQTIKAAQGPYEAA